MTTVGVQVGQSDHTSESKKTKLMTSFCHFLLIAYLNIVTCLSFSLFNCCLAVSLSMLELFFFLPHEWRVFIFAVEVRLFFHMVFYYFDISHLRSCHVLTRHSPFYGQMVVPGWGTSDSLSGQLWVSLLFDDIYSSQLQSNGLGIGISKQTPSRNYFGRDRCVLWMFYLKASIFQC